MNTNNLRPEPQAHCLTTGLPGEPTSASFGRIVSPAQWTANVLCGQSSYDNTDADFQPGVYLDGKIVNYEESAKLHLHSCEGFDWGTQSPGAAQLALALLLEVVSPAEALDLRFRFAAEVVARLPKGRSALCLSRQEVLSWVSRVGQ